MNILQISIQAPGYNSGGTLGILQFSYALTRNNNVTYIGPKIENKEIESWFNQTMYMSRKLTKFEKIQSIIHMHFDKYYVLWNKIDINFNDYDVIYIDFTRWDYVVKRIKKSGYEGKIIIRAHNVEKDYLYVEYKSEKSLKSYINYLFAAFREKYMVNMADTILAITPEDKNRLIELYNLDKEKIVVCPVGVNSSACRKKKSFNKYKKLNCLITGSLWFGPNASGALWVLKEVMPIVSDICELTIAGANPNEDIKNACKKTNTKLIPSPESMQPYFDVADMVLVPIFDGGGMKVKVAEAMSYNLPVVLTTHGNIGYKIIDYKTGFIADKPEDFASRIRYYWNMSVEKKEEFLDKEWELYKDNYSLEAICNVVNKLLKN